MQSFKKFLYILLIFLPLFAVSCSAKVTRFYHDESFTLASIASSKMAVGGVTSTEDDLSIEQTQKYSSLLRARFEAIRKDFSFAEGETILKSLGDDEHSKILDEYKSTGKLSDSSLNLLKTKIDGIRYLILARIEEDDFWIKRSRRNIYEYEYSHYNDRPAKILVGVDRRYRTYRAMTVYMSVYDIYECELVWGGALSDYLRNVKSESSRWGYSDISPFSYPAPPPSEEILELIFDGFAKNFPKIKQD